MNFILSLFAIGLGSYITEPLSDYAYARIFNKNTEVNQTMTGGNIVSLQGALIESFKQPQEKLQEIFLAPTLSAKGYATFKTLVETTGKGFWQLFWYKRFFPKGPGYSTPKGMIYASLTSMVARQMNLSSKILIALFRKMIP